MIEIFKGETLLKTIEPSLPFNPGDKLYIKVFKIGADKSCYSDIIEVNEESTSVELEIPAKITETFNCVNLILEVKLVTPSEYVKINQYKLTVKSRCINE